ncbi:glycogen debranching enzyme N-terminal domain-containing protein [Coprobacter tertius]|uniref:Amylo-alpha-1,6-glucosidase n=1 Tax=Coprobacter tertius TaxID=2944915 RepID=A0ABT1MGN6_9BACT|nr:glycogen debranching enzyme N-terminal domain-containing protein [Coprobacter tertius]MCP9611519.1 amylo-alpha-1,6-glucosidase [Coprobacter tertius]
MSYLKFDKSLMINLEQSLPKEILRTNKSGAYHCTTIVDCNTRKQHGLLVIPIPELDSDNHVLLSSLDETVIQHGAPFNLGLHKYQGNCYSPNGHKYIREFTCESVPQTIYRVGGVVLTKEKVFISHENRILIKYTLVDAHSETTLQFRPFLAFRNANALCVENQNIDQSYELAENGISYSLYPGYPRLYMQFSKPVTFTFGPYWNKGIEYIKDQERGYEYKEDLYVPGYFELPIKKGESIIFSAGIGEIKPRSLNALYAREIKNRTFRSSFFNSLKNSAQQFYIKRGKDNYLLAGYPWFKVRARDTFIALPGCTLAIGDKEMFEKIMATAEKAIRHFMKTGEKDTTIQEIDEPDIILWCIWALQQYAKEISLTECSEKYGKLIDEMIDYIMKGHHPNLFLHENGLLYSNGKDQIISWMNSTLYGRPLIPRSGYLVEFNALWYNALKFVASLPVNSEKTGRIEKLEALAEKSGMSFKDMFLNDCGYLFDYVDGNFADWSVRPNMLFALSTEFSPLDKTQRKTALDVVTRELLTPKGIRTLSPKSHGYNPTYAGSQEERDKAYHQGSTRPWLMGAYADAYLKVFGLSGVSFLERMLIGFEEEMSNNCIGTISELFDGNPPFMGRGAISFAPNVGEILRILNLLKKYNHL